MRILPALMATLLLACNFAEARNCKLDIGAGFRQDRLVWELAGPDDVPPVMSKLTWKRIRIFEMHADFKKINSQNIYFRGNATYGWVFNGHNQDSDFDIDGNGSIVEFSRSNNKAGNGEVFDLTAGAGYFLRCFHPKFRLVPIGGYSMHEQHFVMFDGFQTIALDDPSAEGHHFRHLHSSYKTRWWGPWAGLDAYWHWTESITMSGTFEYHWVKYSAHGHWNLRDDILGDFHHFGDGRGCTATLGLDYNFCSGWYLGGLFKFNYLHLKNGKDHTWVLLPVVTGVQDATSGRGLHREVSEEDGSLSDLSDLSDSSGSSSSDEGTPFLTEGKLRTVNWYSFSIAFTIGYNF